VRRVFDSDRPKLITSGGLVRAIASSLESDDGEFFANRFASSCVQPDMNTNLLQKKFEKLGARATVRPLVTNRWQPAAGPIVIDVGRDRHGEYFDIQADDGANVEVLDVQPQDRHLLLMVRQPNNKDKFLCGHDERHWFVAALPERAPISSVVTAKEALKPDLVRNLERGKKGKRKNRLRRKTDVFVRQGEWFFLPAPNVPINDKLVLSNEPISRGAGSKPHICQYLYRDGGTTVYVCGRHPNGLTAAQHRKLLKKNPHAAKWNWQVMRRDPLVYVRGRVSHPDHATIRLAIWHRVAMNTENQSRALSQVAFLD